MRIARKLRLFLLFVPLLLASASAYALTLEDLINMPGKVLGKGSNSLPVGQFGVKSYKLEELTLTEPVIIDGETINAAKAWRMTVNGGPFPVRAQAAVISVGGVDLRPAMESDDLSEVVTITFDDSMLRSGASITLSYAEDSTELPEKLTRNNG